MTPLVLVPGLLCDRRLWRHQAEGLADLVGRVLIPDVTGGDSMEGLARGILETAPERFALAGLSMGATSPSRSCGRRQSASRRSPCSTPRPGRTPPSRRRRGSRSSGSPGPVRRGVAPAPAEGGSPRQGGGSRDPLSRQGDGPRRRPRGFRAAGARHHRPSRQPSQPVKHLLPDPRPLRAGRCPHAPAPAPGASRRDTGGTSDSDKSLRPPFHPRTP